MVELLREFQIEISESLEQVEAELIRLEREPENGHILAGIFRLVHSIKGTCGFFGSDRSQALTHAAEALLAAYRDGHAVTPDGLSCLRATVERLNVILRDMARTGIEPPGCDADLMADLRRLAKGVAGAPALAAAEADRTGADSADAPPAGAKQTVRVDVDILERLTTALDELAMTRNQLVDVAQRVGPDAFDAPLRRLANVTAELQRGATQARTQPIGAAWRTLPGMLRNLSSELGKEIALDTVGGDIAADRLVVDRIKDPLRHMLRNAADHGVEDAPTRTALGKSAAGRISLSARSHGDQVVVTVADDGRGLDADAIRAKAIERRLAAAADIASLSDRQVHDLIFQPGFSTAARVTGVSGRGVGLDAVRGNIEEIGGRVDVRSAPGEGTTFIIRLPLARAMLPALIVEASGQRFAIRLCALAELVRRRSGGARRSARHVSTPVLRLRGEALPVADLSALLHMKPVASGGGGADGLIAVLHVAGRRFGLLVDRVCGAEEVFLAPRLDVLRDIPLFSGATVLGDGAVALILDGDQLADAALGAVDRYPVRAHDVAPRREVAA